ncbi:MULTISPECIES: nitrogen fixation protein NifQ [Corallincola]|uniref:Nitrogen fixation protein NifQ n=3 Tax=Corallincola TaxID=1775176 RepID=A0A368NRV6_9GAMM|nr:MULTISPECIES: nitrogen fixation protein NifQ [Corallincola]RCU52555.1 nitrogen fixation protein NifQ [Corallincola holothuriorum]TAA48253.1 nitrogen fixation protein NifQ [Corallincola spongiicola]TCI02453.1 nitrogen fixation protein NifQ [Corallincola luteus]
MTANTIAFSFSWGSLLSQHHQAQVKDDKNWAWAQANAWSQANRDFINQIIKAQLTGKSGLPYGLGMAMAAYRDVLRTQVDKRLLALDQRWRENEWPMLRARSELLNSLHNSRLEERNQLAQLLLAHADEAIPGAEVIALVVASACLDKAHLWRALGMTSREQLRYLLEHNFPQLAANNTEDMRWKKYFYRCLCQGEGDYVCRAPSCGECQSYNECFGPEL